MRVLLTGATGFIGRRVTQMLLAQGHEIHAVSRYTQRSPNVQWHIADLLEDDLADVVSTANAEVLMHLAWIADPPAFWTSPENLKWLSASLRLIKAFVECGGRRVVVAGSCAEYGNGRSDPYKDTDGTSPTTLYGACKDALHSVLREYSRVTGVEYAWGRMFFVYGPGEPPQKLLTSLTTSLRDGNPLTLREADRRLDFIWVDDAAAAFARLVEASYCGPLNIASGTATSVRDAATAIASMVAPRLVDAVKALPQVACGNDMLADASAMWRVSPGRVSFDAGLHQLVASI